MSRWVRVQADILDHPLFANSERSESDAWLWLITNAAWSPTHHRIGNDVVPVPVGSVFVTLRGLAKEWNWKSEKRVRTFLRVLENHEMIVTKTDAGKTQVTICNYSKYQESGRTQDAERTQDGRTKYTNTPNTSSLRSDVTAQAPAKAKRGSRLPDDFMADISEAVRLGLSEQDAHREADKFRDYWNSQPGQRGVKLDWPATWRNWCRSAVERKPHRKEPPPKPRNIGDAIRDEARRLGVLRDEPDSENRGFHSEGQPAGNVRVLDLAFKPALKGFG
ncbi:hypothetical protein CQ062_13610 [Ochrobactrum sp. MYb68]|nr:hypothetical protein CQ062_13610 [Ochrobactrum sp. MYb68]